MPKKNVRTSVLAARETLTAQRVEEESLRIQERLLRSRLFSSAGTIAVYSAIRNEVRTDQIAATALSFGKILLYPVVDEDRLVFRQVSSSTDLVSGSYGILEPKSTCPAIPFVQADMVVVPGVAFDRSGRRIGYGKGYYDKTLHSIEGKGRLVGLAYSFQVVEEVAGEPHDVVMDYVVTEEEWIEIRSHSTTGGTDR